MLPLLTSDGSYEAMHTNNSVKRFLTCRSNIASMSSNTSEVRLVGLQIESVSKRHTTVALSTELPQNGVRTIRQTVSMYNQPNTLQVNVQSTLTNPLHQQPECTCRFCGKSSNRVSLFNNNRNQNFTVRRISDAPPVRQRLSQPSKVYQQATKLTKQVNSDSKKAEDSLTESTVHFERRGDPSTLTEK